MNENPHPKNNSERRKDLQDSKESFQLQQEENRLRLGKRSAVFDWIIRSIYLLVGSLITLLALRFFLRVSGANTESGFTQFIYKLSNPFIAPFSTLFISPVSDTGSNIFDVNVLMAIIVYLLLGWLGIRLISFIYNRS